MKRKITEAESAYRRVRDFLAEIPSEVLASLRVEFTKPSIIDPLLAKIKEGIGMTAIENKEGWRYPFWYGEIEFNEFLRQLL